MLIILCIPVLALFPHCLTPLLHPLCILLWVFKGMSVVPHASWLQRDELIPGENDMTVELRETVE